MGTRSRSRSGSDSKIDYPASMNKRLLSPRIIAGILLTTTLILSACGLTRNESQFVTQSPSEPATTLAPPAAPTPAGDGSDTQPAEPSSTTAASDTANPPADPPAAPPPSDSGSSTPEDPPAAPPPPPQPQQPEAPPAPPPAEPPPPPGRNDLPNVNLIEVATDQEVLLSSLAPSDKPFLLWFWAPH